MKLSPLYLSLLSKLKKEAALQIFYYKRRTRKIDNEIIITDIKIHPIKVLKNTFKKFLSIKMLNSD